MKFSLRDGMLLLVVIALAIWAYGAERDYQLAVEQVNNDVAQQSVVNTEVERLMRSTAYMSAILTKRKQLQEFASEINQVVADYQQNHLPTANPGETDLQFWLIKTITEPGQERPTLWQRVFVPPNADVYLKCSVFPNRIYDDWDSVESLTNDNQFSDCGRYFTKLPAGYCDIKVSVTSANQKHRRYTLELNGSKLHTVDFNAPENFTGSGSNSSHPNSVPPSLAKNIHLSSLTDSYTNETRIYRERCLTIWISNTPGSAKSFPKQKEGE